MKIAKREHWCQCHLADQQLPSLLKKVDDEIAAKVCQGGCLVCGGKLHRAKYPRKPRGLLAQEGQGNQSVYRDSFCCAQDGCRKRHTPPSVRFLGRKVYWALVVVLGSAMRHGLNSQRLEVLRARLGVDRRTVERWRAWWLQTFAQSPFWQALRARFSPPIAAEDLPGGLCEAFDLDRRDRLLDLLKFLSPITTDSIPWTWSG